MPFSVPSFEKLPELFEKLPELFGKLPELFETSVLWIEESLDRRLKGEPKSLSVTYLRN
jgi:hypothetical protein